MMDSEHNRIQALRDSAVMLYSPEAIHAALDRMAADIEAAVAGTVPVVLVVLTGGIIPAGHILTRLSFPLEIDYLHATRYRGNTRGEQDVKAGWFYRSDQFSFAKIGVPAMYLDTGTDFVDRPPEWGREQQNHYTEVNYHQPTDEYDPSWDLGGMIDDALLGYWTGLAIANADEMPTWLPGDEFEAARQEALAALGS